MYQCSEEKVGTNCAVARLNNMLCIYQVAENSVSFYDQLLGITLLKINLPKSLDYFTYIIYSSVFF